MPKTIMLLAGEASGDQHAAELVKSLRQKHPDWNFVGMGSSKMREADVELVFDSASIAVMGLVEVLKHWGKIQEAMKIVKTRISEIKPDLLLCIDYQEFNQKMARHAKTEGIKVLFYVSPQVWAWRPHRVKKLKQIIDHMAVIFPFEVKFYEEHGIPVTYVGHPLAGKVKATRSKDEVKQHLGIKPDQKVVGLLPGSRSSEVSKLTPLMIDTARLLKQKHPELAFIVPMASTLNDEHFAQYLSEEARTLEIHPSRENHYDLINTCDAALVCSGTVTLEVALLQVPMCVVYKMSWLSYQIMSRMLIIPYVSLVNIVAQKFVVKELLQDRAEFEASSSEIENLLFNAHASKQQIDNLLMVGKEIGNGDGILELGKLVNESL